jgi:hypothetical protein
MPWAGLRLLHSIGYLSPASLDQPGSVSARCKLCNNNEGNKYLVAKLAYIQSYV